MPIHVTAQEHRELMAERFFEEPILNSPYDYPAWHWELDDSGQPTGKTINRRRMAAYVTPIPKPRKQKKTVLHQQNIIFDERQDLDSAGLLYDPPRPSSTNCASTSTNVAGCRIPATGK